MKPTAFLFFLFYSSTQLQKRFLNHVRDLDYNFSKRPGGLSPLILG